MPRSTSSYRAARNTAFPWGIWKSGVTRDASPNDPRVIAAVETGQLVPLETPKPKRTRGSRATAPKLDTPADNPEDSSSPDQGETPTPPTDSPDAETDTPAVKVADSISPQDAAGL